MLSNWLSAAILISMFVLLVAATRVYIGGPDGIEVVWKGELSFADTLVNVTDFIHLPATDANKKPALFDQMEQMGLWEPGSGFVKRRRIPRSLPAKNEADPAESEQANPGEKEPDSAKPDSAK